MKNNKVKIDKRLITSIRIENFKSIKDSNDILLFDNLFVLAGQNESGKSSIVEAFNLFDSENLNNFEFENLNFEEVAAGNKLLKISCTYNMTSKTVNSLKNWFVSKAGEKFLLDADIQLKNLNNFKDFKTYTIIKILNFKNHNDSNFKNKEDFITWKFDDKTSNFFKKYIEIKINKISEDSDLDDELLSLDIKLKKLAKIFFTHSPKIIFFNEFSKNLPNKMNINDLENKNIEADGYDAVLNLEKQLPNNLTFLEMSKIQNSQQRKSIEQNISKIISLNFENDWTQKIHNNNTFKIKYQIDSEWGNHVQGGQRQLSFEIETKDGVFLKPKQRSRGLRWFLALWLEIKARENQENLIFVFDEPSTYMHANGCVDILSIFKKISKKGNQIIFTTHSPHLIEVDNLQRIALVINDKETGTKVEKLTSSKLNNQNQVDALQPIMDAIGMNFSSGLSFFNKKNVLVEGLSDFFYFKAMAIILEININDYALIPLKGIKNCKVSHLINLFVGNNLSWLLLMDKGVIPQQTHDELIEQWGDEIKNKIKIHNFSEIEELFSPSDLKLINEDNSKNIATGKKIINARTFFQKVKNKEIIQKNLSKKSLDQFKSIFKWIKNNF